ncbi:MAG: hypothetical protein NC177_17985 [Ruminococcus flavefaciens]|nr:hypothetical protein [Ruminococcus flavefaciens]
MIINKSGDEFVYNGITYEIGKRIFANEQSKYYGLIGTIKEIRDGDDKETENEMPDIYCSFDKPILSKDIKRFEEKFSNLYGKEKSLDDISLDSIIMAPSMIKVNKQPTTSIKLYVLTEDWACECDQGQTTRVYTDFLEAKANLNSGIADEIKAGCISDWINEDDYITEISDCSYEGWLEGRYCESHYAISIEEIETDLTDDAIGNIGRIYIDRSRREDFIEQIENWDEVVSMTDSQRQELFNNPDIPERIHSKLSKNDYYWESYWESISEVGHEILDEHLKGNVQSECITPKKRNNEVILDEENSSLLCPFCHSYVAPSEALTYIDMKVPRFCPSCGKELHY